MLVEPYLAGTSSAQIWDALADRPHRLLALGVANRSCVATAPDASTVLAHGLDAFGIRASLDAWTASAAAAYMDAASPACKRVTAPNIETNQRS